MFDRFYLGFVQRPTQVQRVMNVRSLKIVGRYFVSSTLDRENFPTFSYLTAIELSVVLVSFVTSFEISLNSEIRNNA